MTTTQQKIIDRLGWAAIVAIVALGALLIIPLQADATGNRDDDDNQEQRQDQEQHQGQDQAQYQDQGQDQAQEQSQANEQKINFTSPDDIEIKRTVGASAPSIDPSHPCALTISGGFGITGGGASFGKAYVDPECNARETARLLYLVGMRTASVEILCMQPSAEGVSGCSGVQDYHKEMRLLEYGHDQLVKDNEDLRRQIQILEEDKETEKAKCNTSINRATEACRK